MSLSKTTNEVMAGEIIVSTGEFTRGGRYIGIYKVIGIINIRFYYDQ